MVLTPLGGMELEITGGGNASMVIVNEAGLPSQPVVVDDGITVMVATIGEVPLLTPVND